MSNLSSPSVAPRTSQMPKGKGRGGHDSDEEEDDGKTTQEEENEINRIMGRAQPQAPKKGALTLAEKALQRMMVKQGLPPPSKAVLKEMLSAPGGPRMSSRPSSQGSSPMLQPRVSAAPPSPIGTAPSTALPPEEEEAEEPVEDEATLRAKAEADRLRNIREEEERSAKEKLEGGEEEDDEDDDDEDDDPEAVKARKEKKEKKLKELKEAKEKAEKEAKAKVEKEAKEKAEKEKATQAQVQEETGVPTTETPQVVFVLGGPGAGKGTQCANIVREYGFVHLSAGDLLRDERKAGGETGALIDQYIVEGKIVPVEITVGLLKKAMEKKLQIGKYKFLIDGFPRNHDNLLGWEKVMSDFAVVKFVLFFECSEKVMLQRLLKRGETSGRSDDNLETIKKRFKTFMSETAPVMEAFYKKGMARNVDGEQTANEVFEEVVRAFGSKFERVSQSQTANEKPDTKKAEAKAEKANAEKEKEKEVQQNPTNEKPQVVFVLGGPGAGKGTQCVNIVREYGFVHLSAGDLLREERQSGGETGALIDKYIVEGKIVPVEITVGLLKKAMEKKLQIGKYKFLIDGFPRNHDNLLGWEKVMNEWAVVRFVLFFECSEKVMLQRLLKRGETSGRSDDNLETIKKRFKTFMSETAPVMDSFYKRGMARNVDGEQAPNEVFEEVVRAFGTKFERVTGSQTESENSDTKASVTLQSHWRGRQARKAFAEASEKEKAEKERKEKEAKQKEEEDKKKSLAPAPKPTNEKPQVVFVLGGPGAGKGTQCVNIVREYGFVHLSAGDLLREERKAGGETGALIDKYIVEGKIVPVEITVGLLKKAMQNNLQIGKYKFLIDGFPRNHDNLLGWEKVMNEWAIVKFVLFFECSEKVMLQRLLKRGETSGRSDDNLESIKKRFKTFMSETAPVMENFFKKGMARNVDGEQAPNEVFEEVVRAFGSKFKRVGEEDPPKEDDDGELGIAHDAPTAPPLEDGPVQIDHTAPPPPPMEDEAPPTHDIPDAPPLVDGIPDAPPMHEEECPMDHSAPVPPPLEDDQPVGMEVAPPMAPPLTEDSTPAATPSPTKQTEQKKDQPQSQPEVHRALSLDKAAPPAPPMTEEEPKPKEQPKPKKEEVAPAPMIIITTTPEVKKDTVTKPYDVVHGNKTDKKQEKKKKADKKQPFLVVSKPAPVEPEIIKAARESNWSSVKSLITSQPNIQNINTVDPSSRNLLNFAIRANELDIIKFLVLEHKINLTSIDNRGNTALHGAARNGNVELVKFFLNEAKMEADILDKKLKRTALHLATKIGSLEMIKLLLEHKANLFHLDKNRNSVLHITVTRTPKEKQTEIINFLVASKFNLELDNKNHQTALHLAVKEGNLPLIQLLLKNKANLHVSDHDGSTPLLHAATYKKWDIVRHLVELGAHVNDALTKGQTTLNLAAKAGETDLCKFLITKGAHLLYSDKTGATALHVAAKEGKADVVKLLLDNRADLSHSDRNKRNAMYWAARNNHVDAAKILIEHKANVELVGIDGISILLQMALSNAWKSFLLVLPHIRSTIDAFDKQRRNALLIASRRGEVNVVQSLINRRANLYHVDSNARSSLHWAASANKLEVCKILIDNLADVHGVDRNQHTALHLVCNTWEPKHKEVRNKTRHEIMKLLIQNNANVAQYPDLLLHACAKKKWDLVQKLIEFKADISATDKKGHTVAAYALASKQWDLVSNVIESKSVNHPVNHWGERLLQLSATYGQVSLVKKLITSGADLNATDNSGFSALHAATAAGEAEIVKILTEAKANPLPTSNFIPDTFLNSWSLFVCESNEKFNGPNSTLVALNRFLPANLAQLVVEYMIVEISLHDNSIPTVYVSSQPEFLSLFKWKKLWIPGFPKSFLHSKASKYGASTELSLIRSQTHKVVSCSKRIENASSTDLALDVGGRIRLIPKNGVSNGEYELTIQARGHKEASNRITKKINLNVIKTDNSPSVTPKNLKPVSHKQQKRASRMLNKNSFIYS